MNRLGLVLAAVWGLALGSAHAAPAPGPVVRTEHVTAELVPETAGAAPGSTVYVALRQRITPGWHTYWRNPGDAGQATSIAWTLPPGWRAGDIVWPTPERYVSGPLMNYVFSNEVYLPVPVEVPASAKIGSRANLKANVDWLVCKDVCIPEEATLAIDLPVVAEPRSSGAAGAAIAATLQRAPKPAGLKATFGLTKSGEVLLSVTGGAVKGQDVSRAYFFPYNGAALEQTKPQKAARGPDGLTLALPPGYLFTHKKPPAELSGVLDLGGGKAFELTAQPGAPLKGAEGLVPLAETRPSQGGGGGEAAGGTNPAEPALKVPLAFGFALLGGLILNLMPCVFPVLSMKAAALARHIEAPKKARVEGLAFLAGCVLTFVALAAILIAVQAAGQVVGWGFQLQSPIVVAVLALIMLAVALNLSGVFEIGLSAQGLGGGLAARGDLLGAFATGCLAVVVAAPCTAPFMAPAIGWALTQPALVALLIFAGLGLGLALPFTALAYAPGLFRRMPRPGVWMETLRRVLAFPMYGAAAWLVWVFVLEAGAAALPFLLAAAVILAFASFVWGLSQKSERPWGSRLVAALALILTAPLIAFGVSSAGAAPAGAASATSAPVAGVAAEAWSPERVETLKASGKPVFVDFTAAWCVTCQVNERTALATAEVADAFRKTGAVYLKADWTNRNADIARALTSVGRSGVPLYLLYDGKNPEPKILPQLLTSGGVVEALNGAAARRGA